MNVVKRNGDIVPFDADKIENAITMAYIDTFNSTPSELPEYIHHIAHLIETKALERDHNYSVEEIQDEVEKQLMIYDVLVARNYIRYRYKREVARQFKDDFFAEISKKLNAEEVVNQNANVDERSFGGRKGETDSLVMKQYALDYCMSKKHADNHRKNRIYIHDLDSYAVGMHNCLSIPFDDLLKKGFNTRQTDVRPANSINTAFQLIAVIFQLQSLQQFGGVAATHLDWTMVPYVRKSFFKHYKDGLKYVEGYAEEDLIKEMTLETGITAGDISIVDDYAYSHSGAYQYALEMTQRELDQAVEGMYHNLNTLQSRSGNQLPFTSINYGTCTLTEGRMVTKSLLMGSINGVGKLHKTPIFPCGIFKLKKGINRAPGDPNYDLFRLALESTAKRLYPNYANVDWSVNKGYDENDPAQEVATINEILWS